MSKRLRALRLRREAGYSLIELVDPARPITLNYYQFAGNPITNAHLRIFTHAMAE